MTKNIEKYAFFRAIIWRFDIIFVILRRSKIIFLKNSAPNLFLS